MFEELNLNPLGKRVGDCVIRAIAYALQYTWERTFIELALEGFAQRDMPSSNPVWDSYLRKKGFRRYVIPDTCPSCYTIQDFCIDHPDGAFILATGSHVVAVENGNYYDTWDSGNEIPIYYYVRR